jgi:hypothetical protein
LSRRSENFKIFERLDRDQGDFAFAVLGGHVHRFADLAGADTVGTLHLAEALQLQRVLPG